MSKPNRLAHATSPYLLQHAHNPVDWFEWSAEALGKAADEDKPILLSIGYSSCHWCHVMAHESFENEEVAAIMNEAFVCIKLDREERPDVDQIYMEAVQAMGSHGGWPLNVFLTPQQRPFYGGTYFPKAAWINLLRQIQRAWRDRRKDIDETSANLAEHLQKSDLERFLREPEADAFTPASLGAPFQVLSSRFDHTWGGTDKAPKFVMPSIWLYLLRHYRITGNKDALEMVTYTLEKMCRAGLYDQVGGGFARYSVDAQWFAPHFEKMLYDNAQLLSLFAECHTYTKDPFSRTIVSETFDWLNREMSHRDGGFYSALDADSEGMEGKFYTWTWEELESELPGKSGLFTRLGATTQGNWEHGRNILYRPGNIDNEWITARAKLLESRTNRVRPGLDDKILAGWNAMTIQGLVDAYFAFTERRFLGRAIACMDFIERRLIGEDRLFRSYKGKTSSTEGFLEDHAYLIQAYTSLYQATFNETYLQKAEHWMENTLDRFYDPHDGFFNVTSKTAERLIASKKDIFDNVIPSGNSVMARNLFRLGTILEKEEWEEKSRRMVKGLATLIASEPGYMSNWGILYEEMVKGLTEVVIMGPNADDVRELLSSHPNPFVLWKGSTEKSNLPLLRERAPANKDTTIYVCHQKTCQLPTTDVQLALQQIH